MLKIPLENIYSNKFIPPTADWSTFSQQLNKKEFSLSKRKLLHKAIANHYRLSEITLPKNVDLLLSPNTFTVTTGHQLCLFGGPQYFIHKIVSVINTSRKLKEKHPDYNFIPCFWMASEDHDFEEISELNIFNKKIKVSGENNRPVGKIPTNEFSSALKELEQLFNTDPRGDYILSVFREAFKRNNWSASTTYWLANLFKDYGLVIVDADSKELKASFTSIFEKEIEEKFIYHCVNKKNKELLTLGIKPQVNPRDLNLFYITNGQRQRIISENEHFKIGEKQYSKLEILELLKLNPENFSPNVLFRPIFQEHVLPNLAYIGGPAEISYWNQLNIAFDAADTTFPILLLRDHFVWMKNSDLNWWESIGLSKTDLVLDFDSLVKKIILKKHAHFFNVDLELEEINTKIKTEINAVDSSILPMLNSELAKFSKGVKRIQAKLNSSAKRKDELFFSKIKKVQEVIVKDKVLVERLVSFIPIFISLEKEYLALLVKHSDPFDLSLKVLFKD